MHSAGLLDCLTDEALACLEPIKAPLAIRTYLTILMNLLFDLIEGRLHQEVNYFCD